MSNLNLSSDGSRPPMEQISEWAKKYRGATVEDLDPPPALSMTLDAPISQALISAFERDYTHLTVTSDSKALVGYLSIPRLRAMLEKKEVRETDAVEKAMQKFERKGRKYQVITLETPLEELEAFYEGVHRGGEKQDFAVVTDPARRFVLGVVTRDDLAEFVRRRPA